MADRKKFPKSDPEVVEVRALPKTVGLRRSTRSLPPGLESKRGGNGSPDPTDLIFIGYAHESERWLEQVRLPFKPAEGLGLIEVFSDKDIAGGDFWKHRIPSKIRQAKLAILLIDSYFLNSKYCLEDEVPLLLERQERGEIRIIPILVEPCHWWLFPWLEQLQLHTFDKLALSELPRNRVQTHLSAFAREILESLGVIPEQPDPDRPSPGSPVVTLGAPSGSVIQLDRHRFGWARDIKDLAALVLEFRRGVPEADGSYRIMVVGSFRFGKSALMSEWLARDVRFDTNADGVLDDGDIAPGYDEFLGTHKGRLWRDGAIRLLCADRAGGGGVSAQARVWLGEGVSGRVFDRARPPFDTPAAKPELLIHHGDVALGYFASFAAHKREFSLGKSSFLDALAAVRAVHDVMSSQLTDVWVLEDGDIAPVHDVFFTARKRWLSLRESSVLDALEVAACDVLLPIEFDADRFIKPIFDGLVLDKGDIEHVFDKFWRRDNAIQLWRDGVIRLSRADLAGEGGVPPRSQVWLGDGVLRRVFDCARPPLAAPAAKPELLTHQEAAGRPLRSRARLHHELAVPFLFDPAGDRFARSGALFTLLPELLEPQVSVVFVAPGVYRLVRNLGMSEVHKEIRIDDVSIFDGSVLDNGDIVHVFDKVWRDGTIWLSRADRVGGGGVPPRAQVWLGEGMSGRDFDRSRPPLDAPAAKPELLTHQEAVGQSSRPRAWLHHELAVPFFFDPGGRFFPSQFTLLHEPQVCVASAAPGVYLPLRGHTTDPTAFFGMPEVRKEIGMNDAWDDGFPKIGGIDDNCDGGNTWDGDLPPGSLILGLVINACRSTGELLPF